MLMHVNFNLLSSFVAANAQIAPTQLLPIMFDSSHPSACTMSQALRFDGENLCLPEDLDGTGTVPILADDTYLPALDPLPSPA